MTTNEILRNLIREEVRKALAKHSLNEDFASPILKSLLKGTGKNQWETGYSKDIAQAFYNFTKVALDKVTDADIRKMSPVEAYKTLKKEIGNTSDGTNLIAFYVSEKGGENPYAKDSYTKKINPGTLLGIATADNRFFSMNWPKYAKSKGPSMGIGSGDNLGIAKTGSGYGSTGLYNVKRVAEVADAAYVIDLTNLRAKGLGTQEKIALRTSQKSGAVAFMTADQFKKDNMSRYQAILKDRAANEGSEVIVKGVQAAIQTVSNALSQAVGSMKTGKYSDIIVGHNPKGREVRASDAANFLRNVLDNFERYVSYSKQAEEGKKQGGLYHAGSSYSEEQAKSYALELKKQINKANNMDYAW